MSVMIKNLLLLQSCWLQPKSNLITNTMPDYTADNNFGMYLSISWYSFIEIEVQIKCNMNCKHAIQIGYKFKFWNLNRKDFIHSL